MKSRIPYVKLLFSTGLIAAFLMHVVLLFNTHSHRLSEISRSFGQHGLWRSSNFAFGQKVANFYQFLNERIPQEATVAIPVLTDSPVSLMRMSYVEFFLQPRIIEYCESTAQRCLDQLADKNYAVLIINLETIQAKEEWGDRLQTFNSDWAVLLPETSSTGRAWEPFNSFFEITTTMFPALLFIGALLAPGTWLAKKTIPTEHFFLHTALGTGVGIGWFTLSLYIVLLWGVSLTNSVIWGLVVAYWLFVVFLAKLLSSESSAAALPSSKPLERWWVSFVLLLPIGASLLLSVGNGYTTTDELVLWGAKGYGIVVEGLSQGVTERGTLTTFYPLNIPLAISTFLTLFGERLPESKLVFPLFLLGSIGFIYSFLRRLTSDLTAVLATLLISTTPIIFAMSTLAHGNLPLTFYLVGASLLFYFAQTISDMRQSRTYWFWGVAFLLLCAWTRPEGIHLAWAITLAISILYKHELLQDKVKLFSLLAGLLAYTLLWVFTSPLVYYKSGFTDGAFSTAFWQILQGDLNFWEAGFILKTFALKVLQTQDWGNTGWVITAAGILTVLFIPRNKALFSVFVFGVVVFLSVYAGFFANTYTFYDNLDIGNWMDTSFMRLILPAVVLLWIYFVSATLSYFFPKTNE